MNSRPPAQHTGALPTELTGRLIISCPFFFRIRTSEPVACEQAAPIWASEASRKEPAVAGKTRLAGAKKNGERSRRRRSKSPLFLSSQCSTLFERLLRNLTQSTQAAGYVCRMLKFSRIVRLIASTENTPGMEYYAVRTVKIGLYSTAKVSLCA